ncbi:MAG: YbhB/YbcL family Raf kinase inhibitor-like protein [Actinobacteria bacterium]|nr:YbhB/YbcL family Raf kinase inhibitor-like protein [Actinomycetota bacterium]
MGLRLGDLRVTSDDFESEAGIPAECSQDGANRAPVIRISGVPADAVELALVCHDPDAPLPQGFTHWTLYNIPVATDRLDGESDLRFTSGPNGIGTPGYLGPQPPPGHGLHHYYFWVFALNTVVAGTPTREEFLDRYADNIVEQNRLVGLFSTPTA